MKELINFKHNIFRKQKMDPFGPQYEIDKNPSSILKLKKDLIKIKEDFGNFNSRDVILLHKDDVPAKTKRCALEIISMHESITHSTNKLSNYNSDNFVVQIFINFKKEYLHNYIKYVDNILNLFELIENKNQSMEILQKKVSEYPKWLKDYFTQHNLYKMATIRFISNVQSTYREMFLPPSDIKLEGELILQFATKDTKDEFIEKNQLDNFIDISNVNQQILVKETIDNKINVINVFQNNKISLVEEKLTEKNEFPNLERAPIDAPTIGILDASISHESNFRSYIKITNLLSKNAKLNNHGENVSSIAFAGDYLNGFNDGCGSFNVHLFQVFEEGISIVQLIERVEEAIRAKGSSIRVWNMSLNQKIEEAFNNGAVTWMASELDRIQEMYGVIIVLSSGNKISNNDNLIKSPSDSMRALVVNSVSDLQSSLPSSYSLEGLNSYYTKKPDLSFFGGDKDMPVQVINNGRIAPSYGTSFAAPFIARKLAHLIAYENKSILEAKALLIHSAYLSGTSGSKNGWGCVPQDVYDIINSKNNEIRFIFNEEIIDTKTAFKEIKIPQNNEQEYSVYMTVVSSNKLDPKYGCEYNRSAINVNMGPLNSDRKFISSRKVKPHMASTLYGDALSREKKLINVFGKWKSANCAKDVIKRSRTNISTSSYGITAKIDKRMDTLKSMDWHKFICVVTLVHKDGRDKYNSFLLKNEQYIENILNNEILGKIDLSKLK